MRTPTMRFGSYARILTESAVRSGAGGERSFENHASGAGTAGAAAMSQPLSGPGRANAEVGVTARGPPN